MIRIAITAAAFEAVAATMPLGSVAYEAQARRAGPAGRRLTALRGPGESYAT
jgi:hypothetical protein